MDTAPAPPGAATGGSVGGGGTGVSVGGGTGVSVGGGGAGVSVGGMFGVLVNFGVEVGRGVLVFLGVFVGFGVFVGPGVFVADGIGEFVGVTAISVLVGGFVDVAVGDTNVAVLTLVDVLDGVMLGMSVLCPSVGDDLGSGSFVSVGTTDVFDAVFVGNSVAVGDGVELGPVTGITASGIAVSDGPGVPANKDKGCLVGVKNSLANAS